jgi:hypothetical protein
MKTKVTVTGDVDFEVGDLIMDAIDIRIGNVYQRLTQDVQAAINRNADASYDSSPAKQEALESCHRWQHQDGLHKLDVMAPLFANYRQYGCGGIPKAILCDMTQADIDLAQQHILEEVANVL